MHSRLNKCCIVVVVVVVVVGEGNNKWQTIADPCSTRQLTRVETLKKEKQGNRVLAYKIRAFVFCICIRYLYNMLCCVDNGWILS